jgi:hypothetical protein
MKILTPQEILMIKKEKVLFKKDDLVKIRTTILGANLYTQEPGGGFLFAGNAEPEDLLVVFDSDNQELGYVKALHPKYGPIAIDVSAIEITS